MKEQLQQALVAVKAGRDDEARRLLATYLKDKPDSVPAWLLLSRLATSEAQRVAFLRKVVDLDPGHVYARQELSRLGAEPPPPPTSGESDEGEGPSAAGADTPELSGEAREAVGVLAEQDEFTDAEDGLPWDGDEEEIVTAEPVNDSLDWFVPGDDEEKAIESSLQELSAEGAALIARDSDDYEFQSRGDTLPPWMQAQEGADDEFPDGDEADKDPLPYWLTSGDGHVGDEPDIAAREAKLAAAMASGRKAESKTSPLLLAALVLLTALVFLLAVYATYMFLF